MDRLLVATKKPSMRSKAIVHRIEHEAFTRYSYQVIHHFNRMSLKKHSSYTIRNNMIKGITLL